MRWNVEGADGKTGQERVYQIEAATARSAEEKARLQGVLVTAVHPSIVKSEAEKLDDLIDASVGQPSPDRMGIDYLAAETHQSSGHRTASAPQYEAIANGAKLLNRLAHVAVVLGVLYIVIAAVVAMIAFAHPQSFAQFLASALWLLSCGIALFISAAIIQMNASLALAVRDIARNSFR